MMNISFRSQAREQRSDEINIHFRRFNIHILFQYWKNLFDFLSYFVLSTFISYSIIIITTLIIHWLWSIFFWYSFTSNLLTSNRVYTLFSLSIDFVFFFGYYKHWEWSFFLSIIKIFLIDLILYFFRYFYFALLGYFLLVSL